MITQLKLLPEAVTERKILGRPTRCFANFSHCQRYRFTLWRKWDDAKPYVNFILLNPSVATAEVDDPTMRRCIAFAYGWGFGAMVTTNIFAYRATQPDAMKSAPYPLGAGNDDVIVATAKGAGLVVCGWGNHGAHLDRGAQVLWMLRENGVIPQCLGTNHDCSPKHPLYLKADTKPFPMP